MKLKILVACGSGMGSSFFIKINVEKFLKENNLDGVITQTNIGDAKRICNRYDIIFISKVFENQFYNCENKIIALRNLLSEDEINEKFINFIGCQEIVLN